MPAYLPPEILISIGQCCVETWPDHELWFLLSRTCHLFRKLVESHATREHSLRKPLSPGGTHPIVELIEAPDEAPTTYPSTPVTISELEDYHHRMDHTALLNLRAQRASYIATQQLRLLRGVIGPFPNDLSAWLRWGCWDKLTCSCKLDATEYILESDFRRTDGRHLPGYSTTWRFAGFGPEGNKMTWAPIGRKERALEIFRSDEYSDRSKEAAYWVWFQFQGLEGHWGGYINCANLFNHTKLLEGLITQISNHTYSYYSPQSSSSKLEFKIPVLSSLVGTSGQMHGRETSIFRPAAVAYFHESWESTTPMTIISRPLASWKNAPNTDRLAKTQIRVAFDWRAIYSIRCGAEHRLENRWSWEQQRNRWAKERLTQSYGLRHMAPMCQT